MKKFLLLSFMLMFAFTFSESWAQERTVSGKVTSVDDGSSLPGVNVVLKGTTTGTVTDIDGNYKLSVPSEGGTLVFSFIGLASEEVQIGNRSVIDVQMSQDVQQLSEVVVTAVGIERQAKALGYSVENVSGDKVQQTAEPDALRSLQGKVAGVNISGSSGAPGSATRITIRGNSSLLGDNQPLFVVDGIPFNNNTNGTFGQLTQGGAYGSRIADLDPNNIESINVLKGAAAAALYGTRAANGVVLITTKSGNAKAPRKGLEIEYRSSMAWERIANLPDYQNVYGTGTNFAYAQANGSWGAPFIGTRPYANTETIPHWYAGRDGWGGIYDNVSVPYRAYPDNVEELFETGITLDNSVTITGGNERSVLTATASKLDQTGYVPNTEYDKANISIGGKTVLDNGFTVGANLQYTKSLQQGVQSGVGNLGGNNPSAFARALYLGRNWDVHGQPFFNPTDLGSEFMVGRGQADNPLWSYENNGFESKVDRVFAAVNAGYDVTDWLNVSYKIGINSYNQRNTSFIRPGSTGPASNPGVGEVTDDFIRFEEIESNFIITFTKDLNEDLDLTALVGHNVNQRTSEGQAVQGQGYVVFDIDDVDNTNNVVPFGRGFSQRRLIGVFADISLGYRDWAFLGLTGRNDWSSTLPEGENSFFYPAITGSVVLSEALGIESNFLNFLKVRASWAQVGNDTDPYQLQPVFAINSGAFPFTPTGYSETIPGATLSNAAVDPLLKPERTTEIEAGLDLMLLNNRLGIDVSVYKRNSTDQIAPVTLPTTTGFSSLNTNFGEVENKGIELTVNATPIQTSGGFKWDITGTFTHNKNTIVELTGGVEEITVGTFFAGGVVAVHRPGQEFGLLRGSVDVRDDEGNLLIDPSNGQLIAAPEPAIIGNPNPDFLVGITNRFSYKGIFASAVFDWRQGGDLYSNTVLSLQGRGVLESTADREMNRIIPGVYGDPATFEPIRTEGGQKVVNTTQVETNTLYFGQTFAINASDEWSVFDATTFRLREVTVGYNVPKKFLEKTPFGRAEVSVTGRNIWYSAPNLPESTNFDPEINQFGNSNAQGIEFSATPSTKRLAVNLRLTF